MSNVKKRFQKKTGIEYFDNAIELDKAVWNFVKHEFKNKSRKETISESEPSGSIPYRYWDTHGKVLHNYAWEMMRCVRLAYQISQPQNETDLEEKKKYVKAAIGWCWNIHDALFLTIGELDTIKVDKLDNVFDLIEKEIVLLDGVRTKSKIRSPCSKKDSTA